MSRGPARSRAGAAVAAALVPILICLPAPPVSAQAGPGPAPLAPPGEPVPQPTPAPTSLSQPSAASPRPAAPAEPARAHAEELPTEDEAWGGTRVLGSHAFLRGAFVQTALVDSQVGVRAGIEYHQVPGFTQLPSLVGSGPQAVVLRTINVAETLDFQVRLHDHVAIFGAGYGKARIGANTATLLGTGADYTYGGDLGVLVKLFRFRSFQLSVSGQLGMYTGQSAGILTLFQDLSTIARDTIQRIQRSPTLNADQAINQLNAAFRSATADLITPFDGFKYGFAVSAAQGIGRYVGLQASLGFYSDSATYAPKHYDAEKGGPVAVEYEVVNTRPTFAVAWDFDASPAGLPLAVMLEYRAAPTMFSNSDKAAPVRRVSSLEHLIALGVYYSGRTDLQLGLTGYTVFGQIPALGANAISSGKPLDLAAQLVFRYYW